MVSGGPLSHDTIIAKGGLNLISQSGDHSGKSCLVKIYPACIGEGIIELPDQHVVIGRGPECEVQLNDSAVSRQHARIELGTNGYVICDLNSTNGTYVNDEAVDRRILRAGDFIRVGKFIMKFLSSDHVETQYHETIYTMMISDGLTGAYNRRYFEEALEREVVRSQRHHRPLSLVIMDIDFFKNVNDSYGHLAGDAVLRDLCARIHPVIRKDEVFARVGGEEFAVILPEATAAMARTFAERIRHRIAETPIQLTSLSLPITLSLGIGMMNGESEFSKNSLIALADGNLYRAKAAGRNCVFG